MQKETKNLTTALKGDSQKQGNWGELVLERVLEHSGLVKGAEYFTQVHAESDTGKRHRPDVVVNLPENKHVIIDSKVSLTAYEAAIGADDLEVRTGFIKKHLISVKNHVKELNVKNYQGAVGIDSPDFVLMFMPIEASFSLAVKEDADIYNYAWDRKVVIVSPSTLLATLKTVSSLWKQEKQNRNAIEIAAQAGALYDKFVGFTDDLIKVGVQLKNTTKVYEASMNKLTEGKGNLVRRAEQIKVLGAKTTKDINNPLKNRSAVVEQSKESKVD
jgi:DNA recombination protein RmuC